MFHKSNFRINSLKMIEIIRGPWPFYISGGLIALIMFLLLWTGKRFGVSSTLRTLCAISGGAKYSSFFKFDWKSQMWNIVFAVGALLGGFLATQFLVDENYTMDISSSTIQYLADLGIQYDGEMVPMELFSFESLLTIKGLVVMVLGGFFIGFGTRWAGGCTSGHAISGLSDLQVPSLIASIGFFIGGIITTHFLLPLIFS